MHPLFVLLASAAVAPHQSYHFASLANGRAAAVYDTAAGKLVDLFPHAYRERSQGQLTPDLLWDAFFGVYSGNSGTWLTMVPPVTSSYENGTGILTVVRDYKGLRLTERVFAPMTMAEPVVVAILTVQNLLDSEVTGVRVFSLHNLHMGPGSPQASSEAEATSWDSSALALREWGVTSGRTAYAVALDPPSRHACGPTNPYLEVPKAGTITESDGAPARDDAVTAFQWDLPALKPKDMAQVGFALVVSDDSDPLDVAKAIHLSSSSQAILAAERAWWKDFHQKDVLTEALSPDELALARQSIAFLVMSQVREEGRADGQILASLPPGMWNRTFVRDQAYATVALAASGHVAEAERAVRFVANASSGHYQSYIGMPYLPSVCRYYGDGTEESDVDQDGPNIEADGFGLYLWSLWETVQAGAHSLLDDVWPAARKGAADVLISLIEPSSGLIRADSGIWEHHGRYKHFTNTSLTAVLGLCAAARLSGGDGEPYASAARRVKEAIEGQLVRGDVLMGNLEEIALGQALDGAVAEAFAQAILDPRGPVAMATLNALMAGLRVASGHGLRRNDDGGWYDRQEWVFIDLRVASAMRRAGMVTEAQDLANFVLAQSRANLDQVAELYDESSADYAGAVPMAGFGAGAFVLWVLDPPPPACPDAHPPAEGLDGQPPEGPVLDASAPDPAPAEEPTSGPGPEVQARGGAGCASSTLPVSMFPLLLALTALRYRRR